MVNNAVELKYDYRGRPITMIWCSIITIITIIEKESA